MKQINRREFFHLGAAVAGLGALRCGGEETAPLAPVPASCDKDWWLCGNFAPVGETEATALTVVGSLPPALAGAYLRNGPNPLSGSSGHWFVGDGMVHGVRLEGGKALWYRAKYVQTEVLGKDDEGIGPPTPTGHQANTAIVHHAGKVLCLEEVGLPYEIRASDLSTVGPWDFDGKLASAMTAHPKIDPATGEMLFFGYGLLDANVMFHATDAAGALVKSETIALPAPVMMHDFQMTATHVVWMDLPVVFSLDLAIAGAGLPFMWTPENGARIGVMPRNGTARDVEWFEIDPCYVFHTFNAFHDPDDPQRIMLDVIRYPEMWVTGPSDFDSTGEVWRYSMKSGMRAATAQKLNEQRVEFPRVDARRQGLSYRFGWANRYADALNDGVGYGNGIAKLDQQTGMVKEVAAPGGLHLDELTFVPASANAGEDEGWLMAYGYDPATDRSALLVLDAQELSEVARVDLPARVPHGFHGIWVGDS